MYRHSTLHRLAQGVAAVAIAWLACLAVRVPAGAQAATFGRHVVAGGLNNPAAFTFSPGGRVFYGERFTGEIHIFNPRTKGNHVFFRVPNVVHYGEQGLLGPALAGELTPPRSSHLRRRHRSGTPGARPMETRCGHRMTAARFT